MKPCFWGGRLGARFKCKCPSRIPGVAGGGLRDREWEGWQNWEVARWSLLEADPLYELRILAVEYETLAAKRRIILGDEPFHQRLEWAVRQLKVP